MLPLAGALLPAAFSAAASFFGQHSANKANRDIADRTNVANAQQAREQMEFQERMSNTAYQRAVEDMKKAGINPMLASQLGGSSTPPGASVAAQVGAPQQNELSGVAHSAHSALDAIRLRYELENMRETNLKIHSDTELNQALRHTAQQDALLKANSARVAAINADALSQSLPGRIVEREIDQSKYGKILRYAGRLNPFGHSAKNVAHLFK